MQIWSLHPEYLDAKDLVALWCETLLAKNVLEGNTTCYKNHPQLNRFKQLKNPVAAIHQYLSGVHREALARGYNFDFTKFTTPKKIIEIPVTKGQIDFEWQHMLKKVQQRDPARFEKLSTVKKFRPHPIFKIVPGDIEDLEIL